MIATQRPDGTPVSLGERGYQTQCAACHGLDKSGDAWRVPSLLDLANRRSRTSRRIVDQGDGRGLHPSSGGQRRAIVDFLLASTAGRGIRGPGAQAEAARRAGRSGGAPDPAPYAFGRFRAGSMNRVIQRSSRPEER
jgi:hypothetical protein